MHEIEINVMRPFLNRLKDRGWMNRSVPRHTSEEKQVLQRKDEQIVVVQNIYVDVTADLNHQVEAYFERLIELLKRSGAGAIFLPGNARHTGFPIPDFFKEFCEKHSIKINVLNIENFSNSLDELDRL
jgi:hypothetical protein